MIEDLSVRLIPLKKNKDLMFFIPYGVFIALNFLLITTMNIPDIFAPLSKIPLLLILVKLMLEIFYREIDFKELALCIFLIILSLLIAVFGDQNFIFYYTLMLVGARGISIDKIIKFHLFLVGGLVSVTFFLSLIGIIDNLTFFRADGETVRYAFGIQYPTDFSAIVFYVFALFLSVYLVQKTKVVLFVGIALTLLLGVYVNARLDVILMLLLLIIGVLFNYKKIPNWFYKIAPYSFLIFLILSLLLAIFYNPENIFFNTLNGALSNRLELGQSALQDYDVTLFGQYIELVGFGGEYDPSQVYNFIDSSYLQIVLKFGGIYTITVTIISILFTYKLLRHKRFLFVLVICLFNLHGVIAHHLFNPIYNPFWILFLAELTISQANDNPGNNQLIQ